MLSWFDGVDSDPVNISLAAGSLSDETVKICYPEYLKLIFKLLLVSDMFNVVGLVFIFKIPIFALDDGDDGNVVGVSGVLLVCVVVVVCGELDVEIAFEVRVIVVCSGVLDVRTAVWKGVPNVCGVLDNCWVRNCGIVVKSGLLRFSSVVLFFIEQFLQFTFKTQSLQWTKK